MEKQGLAITALVRKAVGKKEADAGVRIFRAKAFKTLEGPGLDSLVDHLNNGYNALDFRRSITCIQAVLPGLTQLGMAVRLPGIGVLSPVVKGRVEPGEECSTEKIRVSYTLRLDKEFERDIVKGILCRFEPMIDAKPIPRALKPGFPNEPFAGSFRREQLVTLTGKRLKYNPENSEEGVFFSAPGKPAVRVPHAFVHQHKIDFQLPAELEPNVNYTLSVRAKLHRCRDVREGFLEEKVVLRA